MALSLRHYHLVISFFLVSANQVKSQDQAETNSGFIFNGFKNNSSSNLTIGGASIVTAEGALKLTNTSNSITGYAFYSSPFNLSSFSTNFVFQIVPQPSKQGGHGLVFLIAPSNRLQRTSPGPLLGALNRKNDGNASNHMFLIEFNTVTNNGDHLAVHVNSLQVKSEMAKPAGYYINYTNQSIPMKLEDTETPIQAWVDYDGAMETLNVTIAPSSVKKPLKPLMSMNLNLSGVIQRDSYVGFSSATGTKLSSSHYILGWSFRLNGLAWPLDLSILPRPQQEPDGSNSKKVMSGIEIGAGSSVGAIILVAILVGGLWYWHVQREKLKDDLEDWEVECAHRYAYKDLYRSTRGFRESEVIGMGGFGCVYKGVLPKSKETVAIKKILHNSRQGIREFVAEIASLGQMRHKHLVHLHGWCKHKDDLLLVYDFMPNGSLDAHIFNRSRKSVLNWGQRFRILKGIASALVYLHEEWEQVVVHRDVKANNVLLDSNMDGRLGDFGLSRLYDHGKHPSTTHIVGTLGYMAPELSQTGKATTQCDVYSFGALLLEVACGRRPIEVDQNEPLGGRNVILLDWVRDWWMRGCICRAADPRLGNGYSASEMDLVLYLGLVCCQKRSEARPSIRQVTRYLDGSEGLARVGTLEFAYSDTDALSSSNVSSLGHGLISSGSFRVGGR